MFFMSLKQNLKLLSEVRLCFFYCSKGQVSLFMSIILKVFKKFLIFFLSVQGRRKMCSDATFNCTYCTSNLKGVSHEIFDPHEK